MFMMEKATEQSVHLDEVLSKFSLFGSYQVQALTLLGVAFLLNGMQCINFIFAAEDIPYRCKINNCESTAEQEFQPAWYNFTAPVEYNNCFQYGRNGNVSECSSSAFDVNVVEPCNSWIYEDKHSFVGEFNLACQDWKRTFVGTVHSIGLMVGLLIQGHLSDRIGRKAAIVLAGTAAALFGLFKSFANSYLLYVILELLEAIFGDNCSPAFIMSVELVDSAHRLQQQIYLCVLYSIGGVIMSAIAYYVTYWRDFIRAIYAPSLMFLLYLFFMDESVRWLLSKGRKKEATDILLKIAKRNKVKLDEKMLINLECEVSDETKMKSPLLETFSSKIVLKRFFICIVWWTSCTFICFGFVVNSVSLDGNKYINFAIISVVDMPVSVVMVFILKRYKKKKPLIGSFLLAGLLCILSIFIPKGYPLLSKVIFLAGKFLSTFTFATVYLYTSELFPTYSRNSMHALCSSIGRIGSVLAPMTPLLMQYNEHLPILLIGATSLFAGALTFSVPEVANESLPDNVRQAERLGENYLTKATVL